MEIPGIDTILCQPARIVWSGETTPSDELARLFDEIPRLLEWGHLDEVATQLDKIARHDLEPSQTMRLHFLQGRLFHESQDYRQACRFYDQALDIALEYHDLDSQITLIDYVALMKYALMEHRDAMLLYQEAFALWNERAQQLSNPRAEPRVKFLERIGATQWQIGEFDAARNTLAKCLVVARYKPGVPHTDFIRDRTARALWALGLTLRSQSDQLDGSSSHLHNALKQMKRAGKIHELLGVEQEQMGRLHVQIAELYLDLAEIHLQREHDDEAYAMRAKALAHAREAVELLKFTESRAGRLLPELTLLRHEITRRRGRTAAEQAPEFEAKLLGIEFEAAEIGDHVISSKAATLRGEWCLWFGQPEPAIKALGQALTGFQADNKGEVTRAQRLLRRALEPAQPPRQPRRRSNGPVPPTKPSASTDGGDTPA